MIATIQTSTAEINVVDALWTLIQQQKKSVRKALIKKLVAEDEKTRAQQKLVQDSMTKAFAELRAGQARPNARQLFVD